MINGNTAVTPESLRKIDQSANLWPVFGAALGLLCILIWMHGGLYKQDLVILTVTYSLIALGMYIPFVLGGSLSLAYSAYAGIGAYAVGLMSTKTELPLWVGIAVGAAVAIGVAVLLSFATRRLSGFFLAAVTLLFGAAFEQWLIALEPITGGSGGISGVGSLELFGWTPNRWTQVVIAMVMVAAVAIFVDRLRRSSLGTILQASREVPLAVNSMGVRVPSLMTVALAAGAAIASLGGSLFASFVGTVTPETFTISIVFLAIFMPLIGGRGTSWGAIIGAVLVVSITVNLPGLEASGQLMLSIAVLIILLFAPAGLLGYLNSSYQGLRLRRKATHNENR